jgi:hypothetical protein
MFLHQNPVHASPPLRATCSAQLILLYFITRTVLDEEYRSSSSSFRSFLHSPVNSSILAQIFSSTHYSQTRPSLSVTDQISHLYKTTGKIIVLYI